VRTLTSLAEREAVARVLEQVPDLVLAFEQADMLRSLAPSVIVMPETTLLPGARQVDFQVEVQLGGKLCRFTATEIAPNGIAMTGEEALPESRLVAATLHGPPEPFRVWAFARLSRREGPLFRVELQPFALRGTERIFFSHLLDEAAAA